MDVVVKGKAGGGLRFAPGLGSRLQAGEAEGLNTAASSSPDSPWPQAQAHVGISLSSLSGFDFLPEAPEAAAKPACSRSPAARYPRPISPGMIQAPRGQVPLCGDCGRPAWGSHACLHCLAVPAGPWGWGWWGATPR